MMQARQAPTGATFAPITEAGMHTQTQTNRRPHPSHTHDHAMGTPRPMPRPRQVWLSLLGRGLAGLSSASPWLMALGLCGAYATID